VELTIDVVRQLTVLVMIVLGIACVRQWRKNPTPARAWAAAAFGSVAGIVLVAQFIPEPGPGGHRTFAFKALLACLIAFPWFLYRFTVALEPVPRLLGRAVDGSCAAAVGSSLLLPYVPAPEAAAPWWWTVFQYSVMAQWTFLFVFLAMRLWRGGSHQPRVTRRRMRTLALAAVLMNVSTMLGLAAPEGSVSGLALLKQAMSLFAGVMLFVGLTPPGWLLDVWRKRDYMRLQAVMGDVLRAESMGLIGEVVLPPCTAILGARGATLTDGVGTVIGSYGEVGADDSPSVHRVQLSSGEVRFWMSPYAPFFVKSELDMIRGFGVFIDIAAQGCSLAEVKRESAVELEFQATHDALTGLLNRTFLIDHLKANLRSLRSAPGAVCVQFLDLDRFKLVNDGIDHSAGDALLVGVAERLTDSLREHDLIARFGGDEFVVVSRVDDEAEALNLAGRIAGGLSDPFWVSGRELRMTASIGLVVVRDPAADPGGILRDADTAMYRAKAQGRSRIVLFDDALRGDSQNRLELERGLRAAVSDGSLSLHYQPLVRLSDEAPIGVEALFRWQHPRLGLVHTGTLIALAEESDLIGAVGWWVLREACGQGRELLDEFPEAADFKIWVNLSPAQFAHRNVSDDVIQALQESGLPPANLGLEITESVFIEHTTSAAKTFEELRALGVSIAIDDFGTGYSSLRSMKHFPADVLKIDGAFVAGLGDDVHDEAIVSACLALAGALGLTVVGEAVETAAQAERLSAMGCQVAQGFYYSTPLAPAQLSRYLRNRLSSRSTGLSLVPDVEGRRAG